MNPSAAPRPLCPRCDYDQTGTVAGWHRAGACPLAGRCPECGLEFLWADVLDPRRTLPRWSIEHRPLRPNSILAASWRALRPRRLWATSDPLRLQHPVHPWRLLLLICLAATALWIVGGSMAAWHAYHEAFSAQRIVTTITRGQATTPFFVPGGPSPGDPSPGVTALRAFLLPWLTTGPWRQGWWVNFSIGMMIPLGLVWHALIPIAFACLPDTLSRASVRPRHLLRAWAYASVGVAAWGILHLLLRALFRWSAGPATGWPTNISALEGWTREPILLAPLALYLAWFWWNAVRRYLRLEQPVAVLAAMLGLAGLAAFTLGALVGGREIIRWGALP